MTMIAAPNTEKSNGLVKEHELRPQTIVTWTDVHPCVQSLFSFRVSTSPNLDGILEGWKSRLRNIQT